MCLFGSVRGFNKLASQQSSNFWQNTGKTGSYSLSTPHLSASSVSFIMIFQFINWNNLSCICSIKIPISLDESFTSVNNVCERCFYNNFFNAARQITLNNIIIGKLLRLINSDNNTS